MSKCTYLSSYGATRKLTAAQKLAEIACERKADHERRSLPARFWESPEWSHAYLAQLRAANRLLKVYPPEVIFRTLQAAPHVWSLGVDFLRERLDAEDGRYRSEMKRARETAPPQVHTTVATPRQGVSSGRSVRSRLNAKEKDGSVAAPDG